MLTNDLRSDAAAAGQGACGERDASRELRVQRHRQTLIWSRWALLWARTSTHLHVPSLSACWMLGDWARSSLPENQS